MFFYSIVQMINDPIQALKRNKIVKYIQFN